MSVKHGLLALLAQEPLYGSRLRAEFEARTGTTWPLNVGQVYTTLDRLERDGLVETTGTADSEGRILYAITDAGRQEIQRWWLSPVDRTSAPRDELAIKLALAITVPSVNVPRVVQIQRTATLRHLQDLTRLKQHATDPTRGDAGEADVAWLLVLENLIFSAEAEVRWLDHVEAMLARRASQPRHPAPDVPAADDRIALEETTS